MIEVLIAAVIVGAVWYKWDSVKAWYAKAKTDAMTDLTDDDTK